MRCRGLIALLIWGQSVAAADLGTWGDLWPVKEPDMLTVIMQRLTALEQSGEMGRKMDAFKERVIRNSLRPPAVPGIGRTEKYGSRLFDPSVRLAADTGNPTELECQILSRCLIYTSTENTDCRCCFYVISPRPGREYKIQTSYGNEAASGCQGKKSLVHPVCCLV